MNEEILQTKRLVLRKITTADYRAICGILQDIEVMYAWEHAFCDDEVIAWINENIKRYERDGFSYFAVMEKISGAFAGVAGIIEEQAAGREYVGLAYIFKKAFWQQGFAFEAADACKRYAFDVLKVRELTAQIRPENIPSRKLAEKLGMTVKCKIIKTYRGTEMPHLLYSTEP